jgi:hypothetical protein
MNKKFIRGLTVIIAVGIGVWIPVQGSALSQLAPARELTERSANIQVTKEGVRYLVPPDKIVAGGPRKDGIPSIDHPKFVSVEEANGWIGDDELVLAITYNAVTRVYPLQILVWHEIVNDTVAGDPILITYCPLCGSGIAYERTIDGEAVEFGTSGRLYNSNLVMYDRKTDTYWSQIGGLAILGELTGERLVPVSIDTVRWGDWKVAYPDSEVLSRDTGYSRSYGSDPYGSYYRDDSIWFPVEARDDRIHPKTVIFGIEVNGVHKAYRESDLVAQGTIDDTIGDVAVRIERDSIGIVCVTNLERNEEIAKERVFWFSWYAFHPDTLLYGGEGE